MVLSSCTMTENTVKTVFESNVMNVISTFYFSPLCALQQIQSITYNISVLLVKTSKDAHTWALLCINENVKGLS